MRSRSTAGQDGRAGRITDATWKSEHLGNHARLDLVRKGAPVLARPSPEHLAGTHQIMLKYPSMQPADASLVSLAELAPTDAGSRRRSRPAVARWILRRRRAHPAFPAPVGRSLLAIAMQPDYPFPMPAAVRREFTLQALDGALAAAARQVRESLTKKGLPRYVLEDGVLIRIAPDGTRKSMRRTSAVAERGPKPGRRGH